MKNISAIRQAKELVTKNGHEVVYYDVLPDEEDMIDEGISKVLNTDADFIITFGGTGLTKSDVTTEVISKLQKTLFKASNYPGYL